MTKRMITPERIIKRRIQQKNFIRGPCQSRVMETVHFMLFFKRAWSGSSKPILVLVWRMEASVTAVILYHHSSLSLTFSLCLSLSFSLLSLLSADLGPTDTMDVLGAARLKRC